MEKGRILKVLIIILAVGLILVPVERAKAILMSETYQIANTDIFFPGDDPNVDPPIPFGGTLTVTITEDIVRELLIYEYLFDADATNVAAVHGVGLSSPDVNPPGPYQPAVDPGNAFTSTSGALIFNYLGANEILAGQFSRVIIESPKDPLTLDDIAAASFPPIQTNEEWFQDFTTVTITDSIGGVDGEGQPVQLAASVSGVLMPSFFAQDHEFVVIPTPEPGTLLLLGSGIILIGAARRKIFMKKLISKHKDA